MTIETVATQRISRGILSHSNWDAILIALSLVHPFAICLVPTIPIVALGLWWNSNTISHNFIHLPFFQSSRWNRAYSMFLSALLGFPQTVWRDRHLAHHAEQPMKWRFTSAIAAEVGIIVTLWAAMIVVAPNFFWFVYLPGYALGLGLCFLHGYFEHAGGVTSHYGFVYNMSFFNDGYHVEHHRTPRTHWTRLPEQVRLDVKVSAWPAVLRWMERLNIEMLEGIAVRSTMLQNFLLRTHEAALRRLLSMAPGIRSVTIIGGGMYPRTAILLRRLIPEAEITIVDANASHLDTARLFLDGSKDRVVFECRVFAPAVFETSDLIVIPLSFIGDRDAIYQNPPASLVLVHDWIWSRHGQGAVVSLALLKRMNLISKSSCAP